MPALRTAWPASCSLRLAAPPISAVINTLPRTRWLLHACKHDARPNVLRSCGLRMQAGAAAHWRAVASVGPLRLLTCLREAPCPSRCDALVPKALVSSSFKPTFTLLHAAAACSIAAAQPHCARHGWLRPWSCPRTPSPAGSNVSVEQRGVPALGAAAALKRRRRGAASGTGSHTCATEALGGGHERRGARRRGPGRPRRRRHAGRRARTRS
jgi:hypothetical protein